MHSREVFPRRQVFFDVHLPGTLHPIMQKFDAGDFAAKLADTGAEMVNLFAKCIYGNAYYLTKVGTTHPGLGIDLLGEAGRACKEKGLKVFAYLSVKVSDLDGRQHPEWRGIRPDGGPCLYRDHWHTVCTNTGYRDRLLAMVDEVVQCNFLDGLWLDGAGLPPGGCMCERCRVLFEEQTGRALTGEDVLNSTPEWTAFAEASTVSFVQAVADRVAAAGRAMWVGHVEASHLPLLKAEGGVRFFTEAETWARSSHRDTWAPYLLGLGKRRTGVSYQGMGTLSFEGWGEYTVKSRTQLRYEAALTACHGGAVAFGKDLAPDGTLFDEALAAYRDVFGWLAPRLPFCDDDRAPQPIGILASGERNAPYEPRVGGAAAVAMRAHVPFDITMRPVAEAETPEAHPLWVLSDCRELPASWSGRTEDYIRAGGRLLVAGTPPKLGDSDMFESLGLVADGVGPVMDSVSESYMMPRTSDGKENPLPIMVPGPFWRIAPGNGESEGRILYLMDAKGEPIAQRSAPPGEDADAPALIRWRFGKGQIVYIPFSIFAAYWNTGRTDLYRVAAGILREAADGLLPFEIDDAFPLTIYGAKRGESYLLHLINEPVRRPVSRLSPPLPGDCFVPLRDVPVRLIPPVRSVTLYPEGTPLRIEQGSHGMAQVRVPEIEQYVILDIQ